MFIGNETNYESWTIITSFSIYLRTDHKKKNEKS
jgi:hypothetical protein